MITHFIGEAEVDAYLRDLAGRLAASESNRPRVWIPIGRSGRVLADRILRLDEAAGFIDDTVIVLASYDRAKNQAQLDPEEAEEIRGQRVLVLDSSVHSGITMWGVVLEVFKYEPAQLEAYSLVVKRGSTFVPTFWALTMDDHDRAYFMLDRLPNNRLQKPDGVRGVFIRKLARTDLDVLGPVTSGLDSMDRITWADRWYDMRRSDKRRCTYLLHLGTNVVGYLTVASNADGSILTIDEVAIDRTQQRKGLAGTLLRWAETVARQSGISLIELWGVDDAVELYARLQYQKVDSEPAMRLEGHDHFLMQKRLIHHSGTKQEFL